MQAVFVGWLLQTWLLAAQILSTREFTQLAVRKFFPKIAPWFAILFVPLGFALDGILFHFPISIGVMSVLYISAHVLKTESWEHVWFWVTICTSFLVLQLWQYGMTSHVWISVVILGVMLGIVMWILCRWHTLIGIAISYMIAVFIQIEYCIYMKDNLQSLAITILTAIMTGLYVEFRIRHDKIFLENKRASEHDSLTDALTRYGMKSWREACEHDGIQSGMIMFTDIDNFKWINDTWGHEAGDFILQQFSKRVQSGLRSVDAFVRFGGDEFQIWIPLADSTDAAKIAERLHNLATRELFLIPGDKQLEVGISMGWSYGLLDDMTAKRADRALLRAKESGKNCVMTVDSEAETNEEKNVIQEEGEPQLYWLTNVANALWRTSHYAYVLTDVHGNIQAANEAYIKLVGKTWVQLKGQKPGINSANKTPASVYSEMWKTLSNGNAWRGCLLNRREDGTEWWELAELFPVIQAGQTIGYWGQIQDLEEKGQFPQPQATEFEQNYFWMGKIDWAFQPIFDTHTQKIIGYEALVRPYWGQTPVNPDTFFRVANKFSMHLEADWACLTSLLDQLSNVTGWSEGQRLFINIYIETLNNTERIANWLQELQYRIPGVICVFEIQESHIQSVNAVDWDLLREKYPNVEWAQDDFGSGEKDVLRLCKWHPDWLKLDQNLVQQAADDPTTLRLVEALADWATRKGIRMIPEGIETEAQARVIQASGMQFGQGYLWSKPIQSDVFLSKEIY